MGRITVAVGSTNPVKVNAVKAAFGCAFLDQIDQIDVRHESC